MADKTSKPNFNLLSFSMWLVTTFSGSAVAVYAYLGIFSRHLADDYCVASFTRSNFFAALWENYLTISDRFSNFMLIALSESAWPRSVAILPALMVVLWALSCLVVGCASRAQRGFEILNLVIGRCDASSYSHGPGSGQCASFRERSAYLASSDLTLLFVWLSIRIEFFQNSAAAGLFHGLYPVHYFLWSICFSGKSVDWI